MRFALTHKLASYLMVLAAAASLLASPELSTLTALLALLGIAASWFAEPPRYPRERLLLWWNLGTLLFFAVAVARVLIADASLISAGVHFLLVVLINKLFNRRRSKDYQQIYVVSFLMLVAATTLNTSLIYALCFVAYVVFATWSLILFHLRREMEDNYLLKHSEGGAQSEKVEVSRILNSRRIVGGRFLAATSLLSLGVLIGAGAIFAFFPRIGFGLFATQKRHGMTMAGFSERVELGQHGTIRDNPQVVMRVVLGPKGTPHQAPPVIPLLWRGSVYDRYSGGSWSHSESFSGRPRPVAPSDGLFLMLEHAPGLDDRAGPAKLRRTLLRQQIYLEPLASRVIFGADRPVALEVPRRKLSHRRLFTPERGPLGEIRAARRRLAGVAYVAYSQLYRPSPGQLRKAKPLTQSVYAPFLQIPEEVPQRVRDLAKRVTAGKKTLYDKVMAVQRYLRANHRYSLKLEHQKGREPIDEFLFSTRRGHCEYFASAMALLLRAVGIQTRHVNGFSGGRWNSYGKYLAIRQGDAHAWTEVLFGNVGWVAFDPTPPSHRRRDEARGLGKLLDELVDAIRLRWFSYVVEYDIGKQLRLFGKLKRLVRGKPPKRGPGVPFWRRYQRPLIIAGALAVGLLLWVALRRRRRRRESEGGSTPRRRGARHPATKLYRRALAALAKAKLPRPAGMTSQELVEQLQAQGHSCAALVEELTACYERCRFAPKDPPTEELARLAELVRDLRQALRS